MTNGKPPSIVYRYAGALYVNLTNRCPTACAFCVRSAWKMDYRGSNLDLGGREPTGAEAAALAAREWADSPFSELVFCGFGEPTMRLPELLACARLVRAGGAAPVPPGLRIRLNTNGMAEAVWGRNVVPELKGLVDAVHVSLNTADQTQWEAMMRPDPRWAAGAYGKVKDFVRHAAAELPEVRVTAIDDGSVDLDRFGALAAELGALPRVRPALGAGRPPPERAP